jgi:hypothetical protein
MSSRQREELKLLHSFLAIAAGCAMMWDCDAPLPVLSSRYSVLLACDDV